MSTHVSDCPLAVVTAQMRRARKLMSHLDKYGPRLQPPCFIPKSDITDTKSFISLRHFLERKNKCMLSSHMCNNISLVEIALNINLFADFFFLKHVVSRSSSPSQPIMAWSVEIKIIEQISI